MRINLNILLNGIKHIYCCATNSSRPLFVYTQHSWFTSLIDHTSWPKAEWMKLLDRATWGRCQRRFVSNQRRSPNCPCPLAVLLENRKFYVLIGVTLIRFNLKEMRVVMWWDFGSKWRLISIRRHPLPKIQRWTSWKYCDFPVSWYSEEG